MCPLKAHGVAVLRPSMILMIGAHVTVGVADSHIADVEGHANGGIGRDGASERCSKSQRNRCAFQDDAHCFSFGLPYTATTKRITGALVSWRRQFEWPLLAQSGHG